MSAVAVTELAAPARQSTRPGPGRPGAPSRSRGAAPARLRPVADPAPEADADRSVTVTVRVGAGGRHDDVLAALRDLIVAAGAEPTAVVDIAAADPAADAAADAAAVRVHPATRLATRGGEVLSLSRLEYDLLLFLAENPRRVFSRTQLLKQVWGHTHTSSRTVDVHVSRLRTKLGEDPDVITTVYGIGYRLAGEALVTVVR